MYLLDTDITSFWLTKPEEHPPLIPNFDATDPSERWISVVTAQELTAWRYKPLLRVESQQPPRVLHAYKNFFEMVQVLGSLQIKPFDEDALAEFRNMRGAGNVGVRDRRIAAIALAHGFTVVTNNTRDFEAIKAARPELLIENWAEREYPRPNITPAAAEPP